MAGNQISYRIYSNSSCNSPKSLGFSDVIRNIPVTDHDASGKIKKGLPDVNLKICPFQKEVKRAGGTCAIL